MDSNKPFIHLVKSPYNEYVYEVNTNKLYKVSKDVYEALKNPDSYITSETKGKIVDLQQQGLLSNRHPSKIRHQTSDNIEYYLNNWVSSITLQLTQQCNFRCTYCIYSESSSPNQRSHSAQEMSFEVAKKSIDFLFSHSKDISKLNIGFYGGEPLLKFDLIKEIVAYVDKEYEGKDVIYSITTNGSLLSKEIIEFFIEHKISPMISFDGPREINDKYRHFARNGQGTYETIMNKLEYIKENFPDFFKKIKFSVVVDPQSDLTCINNMFLDYFHYYNIYPLISMLSDSYTSEKTYYPAEFTRINNNEKIKTFLYCLGYVSDGSISPISINLVDSIARFETSLNTVYSFDIFSAPGGPCIPGTARLFVDVNGNFYPCEHVSETSDIMHIGNIYDGFDKEKALALLNLAEITEKECKNCWAYHHCYQCAKFCDNNDTLSPEMRLSECYKVRSTLEDEIRYSIMLNEIMEKKNEGMLFKENYRISI